MWEKTIVKISCIFCLNSFSKKRPIIFHLSTSHPTVIKFDWPFVHSSLYVADTIVVEAVLCNDKPCRNINCLDHLCPHNKHISLLWFPLFPTYVWAWTNHFKIQEFGTLLNVLTLLHISKSIVVRICHLKWCNYEI